MSRTGALFQVLPFLLLAGCATGALGDGEAGDGIDPPTQDASAPDSDSGSDSATKDSGRSCEGVVCGESPRSVCEDGSTVRIYDDEGRCVDGYCEYPATNAPCPFGCVDGACEPNPCEGVICEGPPKNECVDGSTIRVYAKNGTCGKQGCKYTSELFACAEGCSNGKCNEDCATDADCKAGQYCEDESCMPCRTDSRCGDSCADCAALGTLCNAMFGSCVECIDYAHCGSGARCEGGSCAPCGSDDACGPSCGACGGATPHCLGEGSAGQCVACRSDSDCDEGSRCHSGTNECVVLSPLCEAALGSAASLLANSGAWKHAKMDGVGGTWNFDFWQYGKATSGPGACHEGGNCWATNLSGNYINCQRADLRTPSMNLSACVDDDIELVFWHWYEFWTAKYPSSGPVRYDGGFVELSGNGGASWVALDTAEAGYSGTTNINPDMGSSYACTSKNSFYAHNKPGYVGESGGFQRVAVSIPKALRTSQLMVRFVYASGVSSPSTSQTPSPSRAAPGWYIDGVSVEAR